MSLQKITVIGRLGRDAQIKEATNGNKYITFTLATNDKNAKGEIETVWYDVISYETKFTTGRLIEFLKSGAFIMVYGDFSAAINEYNGTQFLNRTIKASDISFIPIGNGDRDKNTDRDKSGEETPQKTESAPQVKQKAQQVVENTPKDESPQMTSTPDDDDDLPF